MKDRELSDSEKVEVALKVIREMCKQCIVQPNCSEVCEELWDKFEKQNINTHRVMGILLQNAWRNKY